MSSRDLVMNDLAEIASVRSANPFTEMYDSIRGHAQDAPILLELFPYPNAMRSV